MKEASNDKTTTSDTNKGIDCAQGTKHTAHGEVVPNEEEIVEETIDLAVNKLLEKISFIVTDDKDDVGLSHEVEIVADIADVDVDISEVNDKEIAPNMSKMAI
ncbi:hypothetical protein GUJ93_ZPchr0008g11738 [Zizania palustris]|uniref:Uncharacterized protein n=1 Tax=Zizania palustris TaxID=103762 RepID=A0A8J5RJQ3_ZIZPA|nr:hypothetical protein GUJ93_ZPchr0008g11738 [Zizania palustris]